VFVLKFGIVLKISNKYAFGYLCNPMILPAEHKDIPSLVSLINSAYRGEASKRGWTTEADLLDGELRTDEEAMKQLTNSGNFLKDEEGKHLRGCVYLQKQGDKLYLGMLSVSPRIQAQGIGKKLLEAAEIHAVEQNCKAIIMNVISLRHELIRWYERHGYERTSRIKPFPADDQFGRPVVPLEFVELEKQL